MKIIIKAFASFVLTLAATLGAQAADIVWTNTAGGAFQDPANWLPNVVPFTNDTAVFERTEAPYTVTWHANVTNHTHIVRAGTVTFDLQGHTYSLHLTSTNTLGTSTQTALLTLTNGTIRRLNPTYVSGAQTYSIRGSGTTLFVRSNASFLEVPYYIAMDPTTRIIVDGPGALYKGIGYSSPIKHATIIATNGGHFQAAASLVIGDGCLIHVHGDNTEALFTNNRGGMSPAASILITGGATWKDGHWATLENVQTIAGPITLIDAEWRDAYTEPTRGWRKLTGPGALLQGTGNVVLSRLIMDGGTMRPGLTNGIGELTFTGHITNAAPTSVLEMELAGPTAAEHDRIRLTANARGNGFYYAGGILNVTAIHDFVPAKVTTFQLIDAVAIEPAFDQVNLPSWTGTWITNDLYTAGEITYLPPPAGTLLSIR